MLASTRGPNKKKEKNHFKMHVVSSPSYSKFDEEACRAQLERTYWLSCILDILSRYTLKPNLIFGCCTLSTKILKEIIEDLWESPLDHKHIDLKSKLSYMNLNTVHFVDGELKIHKKNHQLLPNHTGYESMCLFLLKNLGWIIGS
jgi:hypothetical protein